MVTRKVQREAEGRSDNHEHGVWSILLSPRAATVKEWIVHPSIHGHACASDHGTRPVRSSAGLSRHYPDHGANGDE